MASQALQETLRGHDGDARNGDRADGHTSAAEEQIRIEKEASESACAEYLACLFLLLVDDERFKTLKKTLNNNFLLGRQEYPKDVLESKRLMMDFDPDVATGTRRTQEQVQPTDVAVCREWGLEIPDLLLLRKEMQQIWLAALPDLVPEGKRQDSEASEGGAFLAQEKEYGQGQR